MIGATIPPTSPQHYALAAAVQQLLEAVPPEDLGEAVTRLMNWHADQLLRATLSGLAEGLDSSAAKIEADSSLWPWRPWRRRWAAFGVRRAAAVTRDKAKEIPHTAPPQIGVIRYGQ